MGLPVEDAVFVRPPPRASLACTARVALMTWLAPPLAAAVVHAPELAFRFTSLDDITLIVDDQPFLATASAPLAAFGRSYFHVIDAAHAYYRPLVTASYAVDARVSCASPLAYHATNVLLHVVATLLVLALLRRLRIDPVTAACAALVFAVHPALVEAVAWIPGRNDSLMTVFALGALVMFARGRVVLHLACFAAALFAKETALAIPPLCIAYWWLVERPSPLLSPSRARFAALFFGWSLVVCAFFIARARVLAGASSAIDPRVALAHLLLLVTSLGKIALPVDLAVLATTDDSATWPAVAIGVGAVVAIAVAAWRVSGVRVRVIAFGAALYGLSLVPTLFAPGTLALECRLYLPTVGAVVVLAEIARALAQDGSRRRVVVASAAALGIALAAITVGYAGAFRDPHAFAKAAVTGSPHSSLAHFTLGQSHHLRGDLDRAIGEYAFALALDPTEPLVHNNLAVISMKRADWARAEEELHKELDVNPGCATATRNLDIVVRRMRESD
jgi:tetratricopeptide (TPR) repeat protein